MLVTLISIFLGLTIVLVGFLMLLRNHKSISNILFFVVCLISAIWAINFSTIEHSSNLEMVSFQNTLSFVLGAILMLSVIIFTFYFPREHKKKILKPYLLLFIPTLAISCTSLVAGEVTEVNNENVFSTGTLSAVYILMMLAGVMLILINLFGTRKKYTPTQRSQMQLVSLGFILSFIVGVGLSVVLPLVSPTSKADNYSPFAIFFLISFTAVAVAKYKLFDFRTVVLRAAGYILSAVIIAFIVSFGILTVANMLIYTEDPISLGQRLLIGLLLVTCILLYPRFKTYYDRFSNKVFFNTPYDTKEVLYGYNSKLVTTINPSEIASIFIGTLENTLQASKAIVYVEGVGSYALNQSLKQSLTKNDTSKITDYLHTSTHHDKGSIVSLDDVTSNELIRDLIKNEYTLMVKINNTKNQKGFVLIGTKRSGTLYGSADIGLINILTDQFTLALDNALQYSEIRAFNITLNDKIDTATKELRKTNEKLKALDEAKDEFISMASHQLRTPLTSVKGYVSMVLEGDAGKISAQQKQLLEQAFTSSQRMVYLIADLLNVSRLKTGKFIIESKPTLLTDVVESEIGQLKESAKAHNLELLFIKPENFPSLNLDETKTRQVIMNFMDNAIYYTPAGGHIRVELNATDKVIEYKVIDDGLGVPKSEQHHLFTKFFRAGNAKKARPDGTGLGLYMARKVIIAQGGSIIFESKEGKGSTFGFSFPRSTLEVPATT